MAEQPYLHFGAALAIGALIGLERQLASQREQEREDAERGTDAAPEPAPPAPAEGEPASQLVLPDSLRRPRSTGLIRRAEQRRAAGLRTLTLVSLCGALAGHLTSPELPWVFPAGVLAMGGMLFASYQASVRQSGDVGLTSEVVALVTFLLGGLCAGGETTLASACAVIVTVILSLKERLYGLTRRIHDSDVQALLKFAVVSMVVLPLLPADELRLGDLRPGGPAASRLDGEWVLVREPGDPGRRLAFQVSDQEGRLRGDLLGEVTSAGLTRLPPESGFRSYVFDLTRGDGGLLGTAAFTRREEPDRTWTSRWKARVEDERVLVQREWLQSVQDAPWVASTLGQGGRSFTLRRYAPGELKDGLPIEGATPVAAAGGDGWWWSVGLSPRKVWQMVVLISAVAFAGFVLNQTVGAERGLLLTGAVGGLVSSTAVTLAFSQRSRETPELSPQLAAGILLANAIMPLRVLVLVGVLAPTLVPPLSPPLLALVAAVGLTVLVMRLRRNHGPHAPQAVELKNPFRVGPALKFGAVFGVVLLLAQVLQALFGDVGLYVLAVVTGLTDVDAICLAVAGMVTAGTRDPLTGATMIALAALSNTVVKAGFVASLGHPRLRKLALGAFALMIVAGGVGLVAARRWLG